VKFFVPAVGYQIVLAADWNFSLYLEDRNDTCLKLLAPKVYEDVKSNWHNRSKSGKGWPLDYKHESVMLPKGTKLEIDRVYVRTANKAKEGSDNYDSITFKVVGEKSKVRFWAKLEDVNNIEYELPDNFTAGKEAAVKAAKAPKKLTLKDITTTIDGALHLYDREDKRNYPKWLTATAQGEIKHLLDTFNSFAIPIKRAESEARRQVAERDAKLRYAQGNFPAYLKTTIKSVEEYVKWDLQHRNYNLRLQPEIDDKDLREDAARVIAYHLLSYYCVSKVQFKRRADGSAVRTWSFKVRDNVPTPPSIHAIDVSKYWLQVAVDPTETEIVSFSCGVDGNPPPVALDRSELSREAHELIRDKQMVSTVVSFISKSWANIDWDSVYCWLVVPCTGRIQSRCRSSDGQR